VGPSLARGRAHQPKRHPENIIEALDHEKIIDLPHYGGLGLTPFFWLWDAWPAFAESGTGARSPLPCGLEASGNGGPARVSQVSDVHVLVAKGTVGGSQERRLRARTRWASDWPTDYGRHLTKWGWRDR
jgi:hypothetical protein